MFGIYYFIVVALAAILLLYDDYDCKSTMSKDGRKAYRWINIVVLLIGTIFAISAIALHAYTEKSYLVATLFSATLIISIIYLFYFIHKNHNVKCFKYTNERERDLYTFYVVYLLIALGIFSVVFQNNNMWKDLKNFAMEKIQGPVKISSE